MVWENEHYLFVVDSVKDDSLEIWARISSYMKQTITRWLVSLFFAELMTTYFEVIHAQQVIPLFVMFSF